MTKSILLAAVAVVGLVFTADDAFAGRRCCRTRQRCCATQCNTCCATNQCTNQGCNINGCNGAGCNANPNYAPPPPQTTPATAQANGYQSFSYEPGAGTNAAPAPVMVAPQARSTSLYDQFRGDRKVRGLTATY